MITFKQFIAENREDGNYPKYPDKNDPAHIEAAKKGGKFGDRRHVWHSDEEYAEFLKKAWEINHRLGKFEYWIKSTFKMPLSKIHIYGYFGQHHLNWSDFKIKVSGDKWRDYDGFALKMMFKSIPHKWKQFMPDFWLKDLSMTPEFDPNDNRKTFTFTASWGPLDYNQNKDTYDRFELRATFSTLEEYVERELETYGKNRLSEYIGWVHDQNVSKYKKMKEEEATMLTKK